MYAMNTHTRWIPESGDSNRHNGFFHKRPSTHRGV